jgi:hypothetical protein
MYIIDITLWEFLFVSFLNDDGWIPQQNYEEYQHIVFDVVTSKMIHMLAKLNWYLFQLK